MSSETEAEADIDKQPFPELVAASVPQLTFRAVMSGMVFGSLLSLCNIYMGLKIGWGTNMSITAALLGFGVFRVGQALGARPFGILENNVNQTGAGAAASVSSAGLVAPIPALTMLTGQQLSWPMLSLWVFSVGLVGIVMAVALRRQLIETERLRFPMGIATAQTLTEMYAKGREALARVYALLAAGAAASLLTVIKELLKLPKFGPNPSFALSNEALAAKGVTAVSLRNLGFAFDPGVLMIGVGALIGMRAALSMLLSAVVAWAFIAPRVIELGYVGVGKADPTASWFGPLVQWMLWPGVAMMVTSAFTSVAFSLPALFKRRQAAAASSSDFSKRTLVGLLLVVVVLTVGCQIALFGISVWTAVFGVVLTLGLSVVAARVSGETGITPVGPMGKVTQLVFGLVAPSNVTANLMAANVTGGAASQCGDLLHDLKTGQLLGAWPKLQVQSQIYGMFAGSLAGAAAYLLLVPDPKTMLLTDTWPAPAVAQWKAVAELFQGGLSSIPQGALGWTGAILIALVLGVVLAVLEKVLPKRVSRFIPSPSAMGLALVVPAEIALAFVVGAVLALIASRFFKHWAARFLVVIASGLIAGESLTGVVFAVLQVLGG